VPSNDPPRKKPGIEGEIIAAAVVFDNRRDDVYDVFLRGDFGI
jgi:hypothetical protein